MKDVKVNTTETKKANSGAGSAKHEQLLEILSEAKGYSMNTVDAIEALYPGDTRSQDKIKNSFASVKTHCWTKSDWRVEYVDSNHDIIGIVGKRVAGTNEYNPIA